MSQERESSFEDFSIGLVEFLKSLGFEETPTLQKARADIVSQFRSQSIEALTEKGSLSEFGAALSEYQKIIEVSFIHQRPSDALVRMLMTAFLFYELKWTEEAQRELSEAVELAANLGEDSDTLFELGNFLG